MKHIRPSIIWVFLLATTLSACGGADIMPKYFGESKVSEDKKPNPADNAPQTSSCTVRFQASLCVALKGENIDRGTEGKEPLCTSDLPPIPIEIQGSKVRLQGRDFPDIVITGHGLPPLTINGKGNTDGSDNVGEGRVESGSHITIQNFSFYVFAVGATGKIPNITLTTNTVPATGELPAIQGRPATNSHMTLVGTTVLKASVIPAADKYLLNTTLQVKLSGTISPELDDCVSTSRLPTTVQITKIGDDQQQHEQLIPNGSQLEVASNIFIAEKPTDVGSRFEGHSKFRVRNVSKKPIRLQIPPMIGAFRIRALTGDLQGTLASQQSIHIQVSFSPKSGTSPGKVTETFLIGADEFTLVGMARKKSGVVALMPNETANHSGSASISFPDVGVPSFPQQAYFQCKEILCKGEKQLSQCIPCLDVASGHCQLLQLDSAQLPFGEVGNNCKMVRPEASESSGINLLAGISTQTKTVVIRNHGTQDLTLSSIRISEITGSKSKTEFHVDGQHVYMGKNLEDALSRPPVLLPITLPPYDPPTSTMQAFVVITYAPVDLIGFDGDRSPDQALLVTQTSAGNTVVKLQASTKTMQSAALEVYFKTTTGIKTGDLPIKGITTKTRNMAVPVFANLPKTASKSLRIVNVELSGGDVENFSLQNTAEKINSVPVEERCMIPVLDAKGNQTGNITDLKPVALQPSGFEIQPQQFTLDTMPLLGCVLFHRNPEEPLKKRLFETTLVVTAVPLTASAKDSASHQQLKVKIMAVISPRSGRLVHRMTQTIAAFMAPSDPTVAAVPHKKELDIFIKQGLAKESDRFVFTGSIILDPFDEMEIKNEDGSIATAPNDGITAIFRPIDTHPVTSEGSSTILPFTSMVYDHTAPVGKRGLFFDYPNVPENFQANGLRIFTSTLSFPGPARPEAERPDSPSVCQQVDPCKEAHLLGRGPTQKEKQGVCAFFYTSAASYDSPSLRFANEMEGGKRETLCTHRDDPQDLHDMRGHATVDGSVTFENVALRFWGPTYLNNPEGPLPDKPAAMDDVFNVTFTTDVLLPKKNYIPDSDFDTAKDEHKVNLTDTTAAFPTLCPENRKNRTIGGKLYSTWKYLAPFLVQDEEGKIPAGCSESDNHFSGGRAYLRGRPLDHATGIFSVAIAAKFSNANDLTFVFKNVQLFVVLNGWLCDPNGSEAEMEGKRCYDATQNDRDALSQVTIMDGEK